MEAFDLVTKYELELKGEFDKVDRLCEYNSLKVLNAFNKYKVSESDLNGTTGYGYDDAGRDKIESIFSYVLGGEDSLVRSQIISGTHAISTALFGILRPDDTILSISGKPYDTLEEVIGIKENASSLKSFGINYKQIDLVDSDFAYDSIASSAVYSAIDGYILGRSCRCIARSVRIWSLLAWCNCCRRMGRFYLGSRVDNGEYDRRQSGEPYRLRRRFHARRLCRGSCREHFLFQGV